MKKIMQSCAGEALPFMKVSHVVLPLLLASCSTTQPSDGAPPNLSQVRPNVWRSGQPMGKQWDYLARMFDGRDVRVLKLDYPTERMGDADATDEGGRLVGFTIYPLGIEPRTNPRGLVEFAADVLEHPARDVVDEIDRQVAAIPQLPDGRLWLVHCVHGQDRTGYAVMRIRDLVDGWSWEQAWREALDHGFHRAYVGLAAEARERARKK